MLLKTIGWHDGTVFAIPTINACFAYTFVTGRKDNEKNRLFNDLFIRRFG